MVSGVQHTIKIKFYSGIKCTSQYQQRNLRHLQKKEDRFTKVYDSGEEPGPSVICKIMKILNILMSMLYLMCFPWFWEKISSYEGNEYFV